MVTIENFTLDTYTSTEHISSLLNETGIVIVRNFLSSEEVETLKNEGLMLLDYQAEWVIKLAYSIGKYVRIIRAQLDGEHFPLTAQAFGAPFMEELSNAYLGVPNKCNFDIYVAKDIQGSSHENQRWHYDLLPHLKFFIYLTDVTTQSGPLTCIPGTQSIVKELQRENRKKAVWPDREEACQVYREGLGPELPIIGKAGTLIIFDSDTLHRASPLLEEGVRLVIRSRCLPGYSYLKYNNLQDAREVMNQPS